jgi:hypothetical protein
MLSSQTNYFLGPADEKRIEEIIETDGRFHFLRQPLYSSRVSLSATVPAVQEGQWPTLMTLVRPGDEKRIGLRLIETQGYYLPDPMDGYVLEYGRCFFDGRFICKNRMCFFATCSAEAGKHQYKDEDFINDARSLFRKVKRVLTPIEGGWYAGSQALELRKRGVEFDFVNLGSA